MKIAAEARRLSVRVAPGTTVSALYQKAPHARALLVLAHGAGAGMTHPFMVAVADRLAEAGVSTLRFQFPYMEAGSKRPDRPAVAHAAIRAAVRKAAKLAPALPLFAGGKSFGGRMTSQAQALEPLPKVRGLVFLGFPLHPPDKPSIDRAAHLSETHVPPVIQPGHARRARSAGAPAKGPQGLGEASELLVDKRRRSFLRCSGPVRPDQPGGVRRNGRHRRRLDSVWRIGQTGRRVPYREGGGSGGSQPLTRLSLNFPAIREFNKEIIADVG